MGQTISILVSVVVLVFLTCKPDHVVRSRTCMAHTTIRYVRSMCAYRFATPTTFSRFLTSANICCTLALQFIIYCTDGGVTTVIVEASDLVVLCSWHEVMCGLWDFSANSRGCENRQPLISTTSIKAATITWKAAWWQTDSQISPILRKALRSFVLALICFPNPTAPTRGQ